MPPYEEAYGFLNISLGDTQRNPVYIHNPFLYTTVSTLNTAVFESWGLSVCVCVCVDMHLKTITNTQLQEDSI